MRSPAIRSSASSAGGTRPQVLTFPDAPFASYFSGNTVQICPVGALTAKPYRFKARPWDLEQEESTCTTCSVGCRVTVQSSRNQVLRYQGVDIDPVNWGWLCDKGRFGFEVDRERRAPVRAARARGRPARRGLAGRVALERAADGDPRGTDSRWPRIGRGHRWRAAHQRRRVRVGEAREGRSSAPTTSTRRSVTACRPSSTSGLPTATIDEACAAGTLARARARPQGGAAGPVPPRPRRGREASPASDRAVTGRDVAHAARGSVAALPTGRASRARRVTARQGVRGPTASTPTGSRLPPIVVAHRRPTVGCRGGRCDRGGDRPRSSQPDPMPGSSSAAAGNVAARDRHGPRSGPASRTSRARRRSRRGSPSSGARCRLLRVSTPPRSSAPRPTVASACLVLLGADPLSDFPDRRLAEQALDGDPVDRRRHVPHCRRSRRPTVVLAAAGYAEKRGTTTNLEGRVSLVAQKVTPPGTARPDWMIAAELAVLLQADLELLVGRGHLGRDRSDVGCTRRDDARTAAQRRRPRRPRRRSRQCRRTPADGAPRRRDARPRSRRPSTPTLFAWCRPAGSTTSASTLQRSPLHGRPRHRGRAAHEPHRP